MKNFTLLIGGIFLFFSCTNEESKEQNSGVSNEEVLNTATDSLPDGEWNGEYMKIKDDEESKIQRKSQGSDFFSMGKIDLLIGGDSINFNLFERKKNSLTFTNQSLSAFIKSAFNEDIHLRFKKNDMLVNHKGKYKSDPSLKSNESFSMYIKAGEKGKEKEYNLVSGEAKIIFSPRLGNLEVKINGIFVDKEGNKKRGSGMVNMEFEGAVMTAM